MVRSRLPGAVFAAILVCPLVLNGCADFKDKFIRKKKEEPRRPRYYAVRKYDVHPSIELYTKRYIFWKNWQSEILKVLSDKNQKKRVVAVEQAVSNLHDMQRMLMPEQAEKLGKYIRQMEDIEKRIKSERITGGNEVRIRRKLEMLGRSIKRQFTYRKMAPFIAADFNRHYSYIDEDKVRKGFPGTNGESE